MSAPIAIPPFPTNPFVGQVWLNWIWNGSVWTPQGQGPLQTIKVFFSSALYVPSVNTTFVQVEMVGAGGGGGGALAVYTGGAQPQYMNAGGGGGAGAYVRGIVASGLIAGGVQITIGNGGIYGTGQAPGFDGAPSSFGGFLMAPGGKGGDFSNGNVAGNHWGLGGAGGAFGTGEETIQGNSGGDGLNSVYQGAGIPCPPAFGGKGGASFFGGVGRSASALPPTAQNGLSSQTGSGGGGGASPQNNANANGGIGGGGFCVVTEWGLGPTSMVELCAPDGTSISQKADAHED